MLDSNNANITGSILCFLGNPNRFDDKGESFGFPIFVYPEEPGWEHQLLNMQLSNNLAKITRNRLMGISSELERPKRPVLQPYSPLWNEEYVFAGELL